MLSPYGARANPRSYHSGRSCGGCALRDVRAKLKGPTSGNEKAAAGLATNDGFLRVMPSRCSAAIAAI